MFNCYYLPVAIVKKVPKPRPVILITEKLVLDGHNYVLHSHEGDQLMVDPDLVYTAVTPVERAMVGKTTPSASNFLSPSLEFQAQVAATLANLDDKFSYESALEKLNQSSEPKTELKTEPKTEPKTE